MPTASTGERDSVKSRSVRSSRHHGSSGRRSKARITLEEEVTKPDAATVRSLRNAYFGKAVKEKRSQVISSTRSSVKPSSSRDFTVTVTRTRRSSGSLRSQRSAPKTSRRHSHRSKEYVYNDPTAARIPARRDADDYDLAKALSTERRPRHSTTGNNASQLSVLDEEVTPEDSISQVGAKPSRPRRSSVREVRRSTLPTIAEKPVPSGNDTRRQSGRNSTFMGRLFRRNSSTASVAPKLVECLTCGSDNIPATKAAKLACGHNMCHSCLKRIFRMSVQDPAHMPPRCCTDQHIPLEHVESLFDVKFKLLFNKKFDEYKTRNRIYCPNARCGAWIRPSHIYTSMGRKYALCPKCKTKACVLCGMKAHKERDCPQDPEIAQLVEQAEKEGWKRCYSCNAMVELKEGCNHMTCRCLAEFCMDCGAEWKTCDCPWFNINRMPGLERLNDIRDPERIQVIYRRIYNPAEPPPPHRTDLPHVAVPSGRTYQEEIDYRRRLEQEDASLARRMQIASLGESDEEIPRRRREPETWGVGNARSHFMNDDFVPNNTNVVMDGFGSANMGRRGERASGRRRPQANNVHMDAGLAPNFLGDASVLGVGSGRRPTTARIIR